MNWTGAPDELWVAAFLYLADINNFTAHPALRWKTPYEKRHGVTPDISCLLVHHFYEPLWYLSLQTIFPKSTEKAGYFLYPNKNVGDALPFSVLDDSSGSVISTSVTRPRIRSPHVNNRSVHDANWDPFVLRDVNNQNVPHKSTLRLDEQAIPVERKYKLRYRPRKWTNIKCKGKARNLQDQHSMVGRQVESESSNVVQGERESFNVTQLDSDVKDLPLFVDDSSQVCEIDESPNIEDTVELNRRSTRIKRKPWRFDVAHKMESLPYTLWTIQHDAILHTGSICLFDIQFWSYCRHPTPNWILPTCYMINGSIYFSTFVWMIEL
jgi:hypothetical protein